MEDLLITQEQIMGAIKQLRTNFKKDSAERKTPAYIKRLLDTLESYWQEFHSNHIKVRDACDPTHPYIAQQQYDQAFEFYKQTKALIQNYKLPEDTSRPSTPLLRPASLNLGSAQAGSVPQERGSTSKLDDMLRKQNSNFRAFKRTVENINLDALTENWELQDTLNTLKTRWNVIDALHWELDNDLEGQNERYETEFTANERTFNDIKKSINQKMWSTAHRDKSTPQLEIPIFSGNYHQWVPFKDLFTESIHNNRSISCAQKMQFLKSKVRGEAERLIQHLSISSNNYAICWDILNNRYNNPKLIFSSHMNILMNLPAAQQVSVNQIKKIHDSTLESLNAIKNLGINTESWDPMIVHILSQKLDSETHHNYVQSLKHPRELPKLQDFLEFLEQTFTSLETARKKQENFPQKSNKMEYNNIKWKPNYNKQAYVSNRSAPISQHASAKSNNLTKYKCPLCNNDHGLFYCQEFLDMSPRARRNTVSRLNICVNCLFSHNGKQCISEKRCRECDGSHNSILHEAFASQPPKQSYPQPRLPAQAQRSIGQEKQRSSSNSNVTQQNNNTTEILLATVMLKVKAADGSYKTMRALIDQGSQVSIISENAAQRLALPRQNCNGSIVGVGVKPNACKGALTLTCLSIDDNYFFNVEAFIMQNLIKRLPNQTFPKTSWPFLRNIQLADPDFNVSRPVDILLGADIYSTIIQTGICRDEDMTQSLPIAQQTRLGWILTGSTKTFQCNVVLNNLETIENFWKTEDISEETNLSSGDQQSINYYQETTNRLQDGRYEVRLPLKPDFQKLIGKSKKKAIAQFIQLENKFQKQEDFAYNYRLFISEYLALGHLKLADPCEGVECYLPHHGVERAESTTTALRVVFNASSKTSTGSSLNDAMFSGPNLQQDLQSMIMKWRLFEVAFTADIEKMFRQIWLHPDDQHLQKIIWRDNKNLDIKEYQLCTVSYGTKSAPFLAMMTLKQLASDERSNYPYVAIRALEESFYMDDLLHGAHTVQSALKLKEDLSKLLNSGGFNLRKWNSNRKELLNEPIINKTHDNFEFKHTNSTKTLGLIWQSQHDLFTFQSKINSSPQTATKRSILSEISKLFDPLGWIAPVTTKLKILFQRVWQLNLQWDDQLPEDINIEWNKIRTDIINIDKLQVSRWLGTGEQNTIELNGFCDASEGAYSCVIYSKVQNKDKTHVTVLVSKTRLVPRKKAISMPRLELSGALLLAKLMKKVLTTLSDYNIQFYGWCDSTAVLGWLNGDPSRWKPFVVNRVRQVTSVMPPDCWRYVKSEENPADCASRGLSTKQLIEHPLWWQGPSWLKSFKQETKQNTPQFITNLEEKKQVCVITNDDRSTDIISQLLYKHSTMNKVVRVLAWILRFRKNKQVPRTKYLTLTELKEARQKIIKYIQLIAFTEEITCIREQKNIPKKSPISKLNPILDKEGILRVDGRLENANINIEMKHPIIIPNKGRLTDLIIDNAHAIAFHGGARVTTSIIRRNYWIVGGNKATKKFIRNCVICRRQTPTIQKQIMGDLPTCRSNPSRPFEHTGVDYTGYVDIKANKGRGIKTSKGYVAVFVCMATKAVHLELVSDLSSSAFIAALRRMAARRGTPQHIYCDNGTNFIGASRILQQELHNLQQKPSDPDFIAEVTKMGIEFHFNAPSWPSAGGLWEAAVKSLKFHIKRVVGEQKLTFEEYSTILAQLEACLNSRPLCALTEDPQDLDFLTPSHFLTGTAEVTILDTEHSARTRWQLTEKILQDIWKRWKSEYLTQLTVRNKWKESKPNIEIGTLVTIHDDNLPPGKWSMGRVTELHPGKDGYVRVVTLKSKNGFKKRPVSKLSILPIPNEATQTPQQTQQKLKPTSSNLRTQATHSEHEVQARGTRNRKPVNKLAALMNIIMTLFYFMTMLSSCLCQNIVPMNENQGIYFDKIANIQLIKDEWKVIVYYDMDPYWAGTSAYLQYQDHLQSICQNIKEKTHCDVIMSQLNQAFTEIEYYNRLLMNKQGRTRGRRGIINGVGNIARSLFGVLDDQFAEQYARDINLIKQNENHLAVLYRNQTSIVEAEYNLLKRSEANIQKQYKLFNQHLITLDKTYNELQKEVNKLDYANEFILSSITANNVLTNLKSIQDTLLDIITNVYNGKFNVHLVTPQQLQEELNNISGKLKNDLSLPINNIQGDIQNIYHLLRVRAKSTDEYCIFEIKIPLVSRDNYDLYKLIAVPKQVGNSMVTLQPISDYIGMNLQKDSYVPVEQQDLQACIKHDDSTYYCYLTTPIFKMKSDTDLCIKDQKNQCLTNTDNCKNKWINLNNINTIFYFCCDRCQLRKICGDQVTADQLTATNIIILSEDCVIKTDNFTFYTHKELKSTMNLNLGIQQPLVIPQINKIFNVTLQTPKIENTTNQEMEQQLDDLGHKIQNLKDNDLIAENISYHDIHHYAVTYAIVIVAIILGTVIWWRRRRARRQHLSAGKEGATHDPAETAPTPTQQPDTDVQAWTPDNVGPPKVDKGTTPILRKVVMFNENSV